MYNYIFIYFYYIFMFFDVCVYILKMLKYLCILIYYEYEKNIINILDIVLK